ncbi:MAG: ShlB/FhaC/HecB family hemolysin secretion/activation protein, partial [Cyanobacteria bacterium J06649_4]
NGLSRLREGYVESRISRAAAPLNQDNLRESLQLLQLDPNIQTVNAELTAGSQPGESLLILDLDEPSPFDVFTSTDNLRSPSIGSIGANVSTSYRNLIGVGDVISASYGLTEGLDLYDINFSIPVNAADGTFSMGYSNSDSRIVEDTFRDVGIRSETDTYSIGFRQPVVRTPSQELALGLDFDYRRSQSFILDDVPFSFSVGPNDGLSKVSALRFSQDWTQRGANRVLAARSQFNLGLDIFDATNNETGPDGQFFSWIGQFQWVEQVSPSILSLIKVNTQLTPDSLLSLERFSLGGVGTVRGYPQNQLVSDNAFNASAELRIPLTRKPNVLQITPFLETGIGWNSSGDDPEDNFLMGTGVGLRWQATPGLFLRADYGVPLTDVSDGGNSLQDNGLYFSVTYEPTN